MDTRMVAIPVEEYKELVEKAVTLDVLNEIMEDFKQDREREIRIELFEGFVKNEEFPIDREICGKFLGFEVDGA